ncbi:hypothetical protein lerEdw1_020698, partial [Lerista edwardsae]
MLSLPPASALSGLPGPGLQPSEPQTSGENIQETGGMEEQREGTALQTQLSRRLEEDKEELRGHIRDLMAQLEHKETELGMAQAGLAQQLQTTEALQAQLVEKEAELGVAQVSLAQQHEKVTELEQQLEKSETKRRDLLEIVHKLKVTQEWWGNVRVFCRVRPLLASEQGGQKAMGHLYFSPDDKTYFVFSRPGEAYNGHMRENMDFPFTFDHIFPPSASQEEVFEEVALLVQSVLDGHNVCIFAFGQTGSGKTYTMEGPKNASLDTAGLIPRAVQQIFRASHEMEAKGWKHSFTASYLEIYNEALQDLLVPLTERRSILKIRLVNNKVHVPGLSRFPVASAEKVLNLLRKAKAHRATAKMRLNKCSSRSHAVFQLQIESQKASHEPCTSAVLNLVDLAGSERLTKSQPTKEQMKETLSINSSLSVLSRVILAVRKKVLPAPIFLLALLPR